METLRNDHQQRQRLVKLGTEDTEVVEQFLKKHTERSMFIGNNFSHQGLGMSSHLQSGHYWGMVNHHNELIACVAHYNNGFIMPVCSESNEMALKEQLNGFVDVCASTWFDNKIRGLIGEYHAVEALRTYLSIPIDDFKLYEKETLLKVTADTLILDIQTCSDTTFEISDKLQSMTQELIATWLQGYDLDVFKKHTTSFDSYLARASQLLTNRNNAIPCFLLLNNDRPVSWASIVATFNHTVKIGCVYTPEQERGNGYAPTLLSGMLNELFHSTPIKQAVLSTSHPNAFKAYQKVGFQPYAHFTMGLLNDLH